MAVSGLPEDDYNRRTDPCGCRFVRTDRPEGGWAWVRTHECDEHKGATMHRHHGFVDHAHTDHGHGACSDHAHWAVGKHAEGADLEVSTPENDPLGWHRNDIAEGNVWPEAVGS